MRRIERLINLIIALLETPRPLSAREIRERVGGYDQDTFEAFRRSFERDKEALRSMGIPVEVRRDDPMSDGAEGYLIPKNRYYLPDLDLDPAEVTALRIAAGAILGQADAAEAGLMKLSLDDPAAPSHGPRIVWGADLAAEEPLLGPLYSSLVDRTPVRFPYVAAGRDDAVERSLEPYGLVHRRGHWYVLGRDLDRDAVRAFRVSRIRGGLKTLEGTYEIPESFDADEHLGREAWEIGPDASRTAVVRFDPSIRWWAEQNLANAPRREAAGGELDVELPAANLDAVVSWAVSFGDRIEIVSPPEARARVLERLAPLLGEAL